MWEEFKEFALKGNALSLAIGVIIGAAFGKIVDALVNDMIMPIIGVAGKADSFLSPGALAGRRALEGQRRNETVATGVAVLRLQNGSRWQ